MITYVQGDIFSSSAQVITNTVNCVGAMGAGIALEFKKRFPEMYADYKSKCDQNQVRPGTPYLWESDQVQILNFPTKRHWQENSYLEDIETGLKYLSENYQSMGIQTLALPPLGCGLGGLQWNDVKNLIERYLGEISDLEVFVYEPGMAKSQKYPSDQEKNKSAEQQNKVAAKDQQM